MKQVEASSSTHVQDISETPLILSLDHMTGLLSENSPENPHSQEITTTAKLLTIVCKSRHIKLHRSAKSKCCHVDYHVSREQKMIILAISRKLR